MNNAIFFTYIAAAAGFLLIACVFCMLRSNSELKRIKKTAYFDPITGGLTESSFLDRGESLVASQTGAFAVVSMQISNLAHIYDDLGSSAGEDTLKYVHRELSSQLSGEELMARTGEDTFAFLLKCRRTEEVQAKANRISAAVNRFNEGKVNTYYLHLVFGVYFPDGSAEQLKDMISRAAVARAGVKYGENCAFYDKQYRESHQWEREMAESMERAMQLGEFVVYYQPKVRTSDRRVAGAEALARWRHPQRGMLSPDMFLPQAEQYQKVEQIDRFVFEESCRALARWQKRGWELCTISLNLSRASLERPNLVQEFFEICGRYEVSPSNIEFEMKEALLLADLDKTKEIINGFHSCGFRCAVDNFGAELCSLEMLSELELDSIKLDESFFNGDNNNRKGRHIIESILKLAAQLHIGTVAEGIDSAGQVEYLRQAACDMIQGFYYFKPMGLERFEREAFEDCALKFLPEPAAAGDAKEDDFASAHEEKSRSDRNIVLFIYHPDEDVVEFSDAFSPVLGEGRRFEKALALFRTTDLIHENDREDFFHLLERCMRGSGWVENTLRVYMAEGRYEWLELRMRQVTPEGAVSGIMADMSAWKNEVNRWKEKATRDALTGLYNREYFELSVATQLGRKNLSSGALLFIDVDDFKHVNDTYGHMFGDDVLCYMAKQILGVFRHYDVIARYGGDEFVVFAPSIERHVLEERLKKLCGTFKYPYRGEKAQCALSGSIGAAMYPVDGEDYETLLHHADCALYEAKFRGKNRYVIYEPYMRGKDSEEDGQGEQA